MRFLLALLMAHFLHPSFLAELARRRVPAEIAQETAEDKAEEAAKRKIEADRLNAETAQLLRGIFAKHPKQGAFYGSKHKRKCTRKTRRAGATVGGVRELCARAIEIDGFRATVVHTTRIEARARAWKNDTKSGFRDVLKQFGIDVSKRGEVDKYQLGGVIVEVRDAELALEFSNGSRIELFGADDERALDKQRGLAKHVIWVDEAQGFRFLDTFYKAVVEGATSDFDCEVWFSGTPGKDCAGLFYDISNEESPLEGWEVHAFAQVDNPFFGHVVWEAGQWFVEDNHTAKTGVRHGPYEDEAAATAAAINIRWANTAGKSKLSPDDPDFQREYLGKWVRGDARYVYPVHAVPAHKLTYAPMRTIANPYGPGHADWYDADASLLDLPRRPNGRFHEWLFGIGVDFGYRPDPMAIVLWAFTYELPDLWEMFSWKQTEVLPDDQRQYCEAIYDAHNNVVEFVGDAANGKAADFEAWRQRINAIPIDDADKAGKNTQEELFAGDIRQGVIHYRENSPLLHEHRHLTYLPIKLGKDKTRKVHKYKKLPDGTIPGDHCADAGRYIHAKLRHHLFREKPPDKRDALQKRADELEAAIDKAEEVREAMEQMGTEYEW